MATTATATATATATDSRPITYYRDLRSRTDIEASFPNPDSYVASVKADGESFRLLHLSLMSFITYPGISGLDENGVPIRVPADTYLNWALGPFLAMVHFNQRHGSNVPGLAERLQGCDLKLTMDVFDTQFSSAQAVQDMYEQFFVRNASSFQQPVPGGIIGDISSEVSKTMTILSGLFGIPQLSGASTSGSFDDGAANAPTFLRTSASISGNARAIVELLSHWNITHAALLHTDDAYGKSYLQSVVRAAAASNITLTVAPVPGSVASYGPNTDVERTVRKSMNKVSSNRYIVNTAYYYLAGFLGPAANEAGLLSEEHTWIQVDVGGLGSAAIRRENTEQIKMMNRTIIVDPLYEQSAPLFGEMFGFKLDPTLRGFFLNSTKDADDVFRLYNWDNWQPVISPYVHTAYDTVMAAGIAACESPDSYFSPSQHYQQLLKTEFDGASGTIVFDPNIRSRQFDTVKYVYKELRVANTTDSSGNPNQNGLYPIELTTSMILNTSKDGQEGSRIEQVEPYIFRNGDTVPPSTFPAVKENTQQIPMGVRGFGWSLGVLGMLIALSLGVWTFIHRKNSAIRKTQPFFLAMICFGAFLMSASTLFLGWQEPWPFLDCACMATPWLITLGFSTAFAALFTKIWRINRLFQRAVEMNREVLRAKDVLGPFVVMTVINVVLLTSWTLFGPLVWQRTYDEGSLDAFGRFTLSYGSCKTAESAGGRIWISVVLGLFNFVVVLFANYQSYRARHTPSELNDSYYVALCMASLLECFLIGGPILWLVSNNPSADFVLKSVLIFTSILSILGPIYLHKFKVYKQSMMSGGNNTSLNTTALRRTIRMAQNRRPSGRRAGENSNTSGGKDSSGASHTVEGIRRSVSARGGKLSASLGLPMSDEQEHALTSRGSMKIYRGGVVGSIERSSGRQTPQPLIPVSGLDSIDSASAPV